MHRILKPAGSIFLHCDWHAEAHIRVYILDKIFGENHFQNSIIWCYRQGGRSKNNFGQKHDTIFWYTKSRNEWIFNSDPIRVPYEGTGGYVSTGRNIVNGKEYKVNPLGKIPEDWWDIPALNPMTKERIGYPTQKPEKLIERIVKCASNEGDTVLDPFVGGGTTIAVADRLNRKWIGIDQSVQAVKVTELRLHKLNDGNLFGSPFTVQLHKYDYDTLRYGDAFEFENWIIQQFGGTSNTKQRGDFGLDGKMPDDTPIQVKRSDGVGRNVIDNFLSAIKRADKRLYDKNIENQTPVGYIIAFTFGKGAVQEVARLQNQENIIIKLIAVEDIVPIAKKPTIMVAINELSRDEKGVCEIEFTATGQSEFGIEFYSWDFEHDTEKGFRASVIIDKSGKQTAQFKAGMHVIAVKVVDNDGMESVEIIKLKVNGKIERT